MIKIWSLEFFEFEMAKKLKIVGEIHWIADVLILNFFESLIFILSFW